MHRPCERIGRVLNARQRDLGSVIRRVPASGGIPLVFTMLLLLGACSATGPIPNPTSIAIVRLEVLPADTTIDVGDDIVLTVQAFDAKGSPVSPVTRVAATSSNVVVARAGPLQGDRIPVGADGMGVASVTIVADNAGIPGATPATVVSRVAVRPHLILLPLPPGGAHVEVTGVADDRSVGGWSGLYNGYAPRAWSWSLSGGSRLLPLLNGQVSVSQVRGVAGNGTMVGYSYSDPRDAHLVSWSNEGVITDLGMRGYSLSIGTAINNGGQIVYYKDITLPSYQNRAFLRTVGNGDIDLGTFDGETVPAGIADDGSVTGISRDSSGQPRAFFWTPAGGMKKIAPVTEAIFPNGIADGGRVVGSFYVAPQPAGTHAFYWSPTVGWADLGTLPGDDASEAFAINSRGEVVGTSLRAGSSRAFLWTRQAGMIDLGQYAPRSSRAKAITATGIVAGTVDVTTGPVPFPNAGLDAQPALWILRRQ